MRATEPRTSGVTRWFLAALCAGLGGFGCAAMAADGMVIRHYSSGEGLPVGSASDAALDADGFLWLATHDGLARFDGREFSVYDSVRFPDMGGNRVAALYPDGHGRLYALGSRGVWLEVRSDRIRRIRPDPQRPEAIVRDVQREPLCVTFDTGLYCAGKQGMQLRRAFAEQPPVQLALADGAQDWLLIPDRGVQRCQGARCDWVWSQALPARSDASLPALPHGEGLLVALPTGVVRLGPAGTTWIARSEGKALDVVQLRAEPDGSVWAGTAYGLFRIRDDAWQAEWPGATSDVQVALSWRARDGVLWQSRGSTLYRDRLPVLQTRGDITAFALGPEGHAFVTTLRDGLYTLAPPRVRLLEPQRGTESANWYGLVTGTDGDVWLGNLGRGITRLAADGALRRRYGPADGLPGANTWVVGIDPGGRILAAGFRPGLWRHDPASDRFEPVKLPAGLADSQIRAISIDPQGRQWLGTSSGAWCERAEGQWQRRWPPDSATGVLTLSIAHGPGVTWLGTATGLWRLPAATGTAVAVANRALPEVGVRGLYLAHDGALWAASEGRGLVRIAADDPTGERALRLGRAEGLPSNSPHAVLQDSRGDYWVNSNQGIFRIGQADLAQALSGSGPSLLSPLVLGLADGLTNLEGNGGVQPAAAIDASGRLWFPTQDGVVQFDPAALALRTQPPRAVIDGVDYEGTPLVLAADGVLPEGLRAVQLRYAAADLRAGAEVRFRYRLLPIDGRWTPAGTRRVAAYAALAPGAYDFEVIAGNGDGYWGHTPARIHLVVPAWWYETAWFRWLLLAGATLLAVLLAQWRLRLARQRAARLDRMVKARTLELSAEKQRVETALGALAQTHQELAHTHGEIAHRNRKLAEQASRLEALDAFRARLLADVSHELRTPLMLVTLPLRELRQRAQLPAPEQRRLDLTIAQAERLGGLVEQLVGLVQAEAGQLKLHVTRFDLVAYVHDVAAAYQPAFARRQVRVGLDLPGERAIYADRVQLTTVLGNLLDNAAKYAPEGSTVTVRMKVDEAHGAVRVEVADAGCGFEPALAKRLFERFFRVEGPPRAGREGLGIGLALARELVDLHGGRIGARSEPGQGATFWFELPLGSAHITLAELALAETPARPAPALQSPSGERDEALLLVEDHPDLAAYLAERLGDFLPVRVAESAEAALTLLADGAIRLVVSDVVLPGMSGVELCRRLRADPQHGGLQVILISAKTTVHDRAAGLAAGAADYLAKPFDFETLLAAVGAVWPPAAGRIGAGAAEPARVAAPLLDLALTRMADAGFDITAWASAVHLSERQLRRRIIELTGQPPLTWLREQRLLAVRRMVTSGAARTLAEAGHRCGLENPGYLYRIYRARFGDAG